MDVNYRPMPIGTKTIPTPRGGMVALHANRSVYWPPNCFTPTYHGVIDGLPDDVIKYLLANNHIEWRDEA